MALEDFVAVEKIPITLGPSFLVEDEREPLVEMPKHNWFCESPERAPSLKLRHLELKGTNLKPPGQGTLYPTTQSSKPLKTIGRER